VLIFLSGLCAVTFILVVTLAVDPARPPAADAPTSTPPQRVVLWRLYVASACLVVPQFAVSTFCLAYLVDMRGWAPVDAGRLVFAAQLAAAAGRIASGVWSDRVASRLRPMRQLALASATVMAFLAVGAGLRSWLTVVAFCIGAVVTVADNGLAFTALAERAGPRSAGRALGTLNTVQNVAAGLTPALVGALAEAGDTAGALPRSPLSRWRQQRSFRSIRNRRLLWATYVRNRWVRRRERCRRRHS